MAEKKFQNLKSHDCHVIMTQLLPVALTGQKERETHEEIVCIYGRVPLLCI